MSTAVQHLEHSGDNLPPTLRMTDVAQYLRIGRGTAYELARRSDFPAIRIGNTVRVTREAFLNWVRAQENRTTGE